MKKIVTNIKSKGYSSDLIVIKTRGSGELTYSINENNNEYPFLYVILVEEGDSVLKLKDNKNILTANIKHTPNFIIKALEKICK